MTVSKDYIITLQRIISDLEDRKKSIEFQLVILRAEYQDSINEINPFKEKNE